MPVQCGRFPAGTGKRQCDWDHPERGYAAHYGRKWRGYLSGRGTWLVPDFSQRRRRCRQDPDGSKKILHLWMLCGEDFRGSWFYRTGREYRDHSPCAGRRFWYRRCQCDYDSKGDDRRGNYICKWAAEGTGTGWTGSSGVRCLRDSAVGRRTGNPATESSDCDCAEYRIESGTGSRQFPVPIRCRDRQSHSGRRNAGCRRKHDFPNPEADLNGGRNLSNSRGRIG